jgi:hypothetical protein
MRYFSLIVLASLLISGCANSDRPKLAKVSGTVTLDKMPVEGAAVMFMPVGGGRPAQGLTDAQGKFTLTTFEDGDGAIIGEHKVTVTKMQVTGAKATADGLSGTTEAGEIKEVWLVPQIYSVPETSGLTAKVEKGMQPVVLELKNQ